MKTLRRMDLDELKRVNTVLSAEQQREFVGGTDIWSTPLTDGNVATSYDDGKGTKYTFITTPTGSVYYFAGVTVSGGSIGGCAYQFNGVIHTGKGISTNEFIHEYGHYLQQKEMVTLDYLLDVGLESATKYLTDDPNYYATGNEHDASVRGNSYMNALYPSSPYSAPTQ